MKRLLFVFLLIMVCASMVWAQSGSLGIFVDKYGRCCDLNNYLGSMEIQVLHIYAPGVTASQFSVEVYGTPLIYAGETSDFTKIGSAPEGVAISYGSCKTSPVHVLTVTYIGVSAPCDRIRIVADPTATPPGIYATDCATPTPNLYSIDSGMYAYINNDGTCYCGSLYDCIVPVEKTSWGQVKAIYQ